MSLQHDRSPIYELGNELFDQTTSNDNAIVLKNKTDDLIYHFLLKNNSGKTRDQICTELHLARSSVFDSLNRMHLCGFIETDYKIKSKSRKGRPSTIYYLKNISQGGRNR